jgi:hypothetical protein
MRVWSMPIEYSRIYAMYVWWIRSVIIVTWLTYGGTASTFWVFDVFRHIFVRTIIWDTNWEFVLTFYVTHPNFSLSCLLARPHYSTNFDLLKRKTILHFLFHIYSLMRKAELKSVKKNKTSNPQNRYCIFLFYFINQLRGIKGILGYIKYQKCIFIRN